MHLLQRAGQSAWPCRKVSRDPVWNKGLPVEWREAFAYGEEGEAWRLRDDRLLIWHIVHEDGVCGGNRGFYSFSERMPR